MNELTRVRYKGIEEEGSEDEVVLIFLDEAGNKIKLSLADEDIEELWSDLEPYIFDEEE